MNGAIAFRKSCAAPDSPCFNSHALQHVNPLANLESRSRPRRGIRMLLAGHQRFRQLKLAVAGIHLRHFTTGMLLLHGNSDALSRRVIDRTQKAKIRGLGLNQRPFGWKPNALPLSYLGKMDLPRNRRLWSGQQSGRALLCVSLHAVWPPTFLHSRKASSRRGGMWLCSWFCLGALVANRGWIARSAFPTAWIRESSGVAVTPSMSGKDRRNNNCRI